jgi:hypothetical protein
MIQEAYDKGEILRTHVLRPTWHFVLPSDIKWMLKLTASRINAACANTFRQVQLDDKIFKSSNTVITKFLQKGKPLTRNELKIALQQKKIRTDEIRMICLLLKAEIDGLICSGPKQGNQFTYMLLDDRAATSKSFNKEESLAELAKRYFNSHSPATIKDFAWWSGLTIADAKKGVDLAKSYLQNEIVEKETFWFSSPLPAIKETKEISHLLPAFDEYTVAYKNRNSILHKASASQSSLEVLNPVILQKRPGNWQMETCNRQKKCNYQNYSLHIPISSSTEKYPGYSKILCKIYREKDDFINKHAFFDRIFYLHSKSYWYEIG